MFTYEMRPRRMAISSVRSSTAVTMASSSLRCEPFERSARPARRTRARCRASARARRSRATRTSAPSCGPPASARWTSSSSCAARISGSVGVPSRRSVPATLPVSIVWPVQSRMSSTIWNTMPRFAPNSPQRLAAAEHASRLEELRGLQRATLEVGVDARGRVVALPPLHRLAAHEAERRVGEDLHGARGRPRSDSSANARAKR